MTLKSHDIKRIRVIIFDLDDTLYPQVSFKRSGFKVVSSWVASQFGLDPSSVFLELEEILTDYGPSYPKMFNRLAERLRLNSKTISKMIRTFIEHDPQIRCYDGILPMLSRLRENYQLGILTDGRFTVQRKKIEALELESKVDEILYSDTMGVEKPSPELFQWFERKFNLAGGNMMYVGDNPKKDFFGANQRGWTTIQVLTGEVQEVKSIVNHKARVEIPSANKIENCLLEE